jgi:low affinity Fe/Cu permease
VVNCAYFEITMVNLNYHVSRWTSSIIGFVMFCLLVCAFVCCNRVSCCFRFFDLLVFNTSLAHSNLPSSEIRS